MPDDVGAEAPQPEHRSRRRAPAPSTRSEHHHRTTRQQVDPIRQTSDAELAKAVLRASNGSEIELDEKYTLTAFIVQRDADHATPLVVELLDHGPGYGTIRWQAAAYDELTGTATRLGQGTSADQALSDLDLTTLD